MQCNAVRGEAKRRSAKLRVSKIVVVNFAEKSQRLNMRPVKTVIVKRREVRTCAAGSAATLNLRAAPVLLVNLQPL